ncbi:MAG: hypothetical protein WBP81_37055, partial [Solirubrobacteraceae bacterium]
GVGIRGADGAASVATATAGRDADAPVALTIVGRGCHSRPRVASLDPSDLRTRQGLPLTSPARTLLDLAGVVREDAELEQALAEAHALRLMRERELEAALRRAPGRAGVARIRRLLEADGGSVYTRSSGEQRMLALVRSAELPRPLVNVPCSATSPTFCGLISASLPLDTG